MDLRLLLLLVCLAPEKRIHAREGASLAETGRVSWLREKETNGHGSFMLAVFGCWAGVINNLQET